MSCPETKRYYSRRQGILPLLSLPGRRLGLLELVALLPVQRLELLLVLRLEAVHGSGWFDLMMKNDGIAGVGATARPLKLRQIKEIGGSSRGGLDTLLIY